MGLVLGISDRVVVLEFGHVIATGTPSEGEDPNVITAYLGSGSTEMVTAAPAPVGADDSREADDGH
jgi:branched-chain amino acid transport system ATP-binding protein